MCIRLRSWRSRDFWPVLARMTFRTPREQWSWRNNTVYGLAASVWSASTHVAVNVSAQLKAGVVWVKQHGICLTRLCGLAGIAERGRGATEAAKVWISGADVVPEAPALRRMGPEK